MHLLVKQLAGLFQACIQPRLRDVLHHDRQTLERCLISDATAHDASAEHCHAFDGQCLSLPLPGLLPQPLLTGEQADQVGCHIALGKRDKSS